MILPFHLLRDGDNTVHLSDDVVLAGNRVAS